MRWRESCCENRRLGIGDGAMLEHKQQNSMDLRYKNSRSRHHCWGGRAEVHKLPVIDLTPAMCVQHDDNGPFNCAPNPHFMPMRHGPPPPRTALIAETDFESTGTWSTARDFSGFHRLAQTGGPTRRLCRCRGVRHHAVASPGFGVPRFADRNAAQRHPVQRAGVRRPQLASQRGRSGQAPVRTSCRNRVVRAAPRPVVAGVHRWRTDRRGHPAARHSGVANAPVQSRLRCPCSLHTPPKC